MTQPIAWLSMSFACVASPQREAFRYVAEVMGVTEDEFEAWADGREWG